jgi:gliding motility-associated lipoprotein GldH
MSKRLNLALALVISCWAFGCSGNYLETEREFSGGCWQMADSLVLDFESKDTSKVFTMAFDLTLNDDYPFNNIFLNAGLTSPSGERSVIPTDFTLSDPTGKWLADPKGDLVPFHLLVSDGLRFNQQGKYRLTLYHFMRDPELCGVQSAAIVLNPVQPAG